MVRSIFLISLLCLCGCSAVEVERTRTIHTVRVMVEEHERQEFLALRNLRCR